MDEAEYVVYRKRRMVGGWAGTINKAARIASDQPRGTYLLDRNAIWISEGEGRKKQQTEKKRQARRGARATQHSRSGRCARPCPAPE